MPCRNQQKPLWVVRIGPAHDQPFGVRRPDHLPFLPGQSDSDALYPADLPLCPPFGLTKRMSASVPLSVALLERRKATWSPTGDQAGLKSHSGAVVRRLMPPSPILVT